ncbi:hypothetical protein SO802_027728 [Lithocarpus litseifolius]|uniref:Transmembrane protein n=1 Tax=Lithocarpus litseifolius TaxID=425828 RepID=A0AAW2C4W1_9ROSI
MKKNKGPVPPNNIGWGFARIGSDKFHWSCWDRIETVRKPKLTWVLLESDWAWVLLEFVKVFLVGVETGEARLQEWWSSERLGWILVAVLWWVQIGCEGGRGKESKAAAVEEDDNGEGSGVRGNKEAKPKVELQKKNVWFVFMCVVATIVLVAATMVLVLAHVVAPMVAISATVIAVRAIQNRVS